MVALGYFLSVLFGYKRYIVEWADGTTQIYSGIWYKKEQIMERVEKEIDRRTKEI